MSEDDKFIIKRVPKKAPNKQSSQFATFSKEVIQPYAKSLRVKNPSMKHSEAVKQAWIAKKPQYERYKQTDRLPSTKGKGKSLVEKEAKGKEVELKDLNMTDITIRKKKKKPVQKRPLVEAIK